jgi:hypothetical protein
MMPLLGNTPAGQEIEVLDLVDFGNTYWNRPEGENARKEGEAREFSSPHRHTHSTYLLSLLLFTLQSVN